MRKLVILSLVLAMVVVSSVAFATIANTKHNLTLIGNKSTHTTDGTATLCGFCHIPHGGNTQYDGLPLWSRSMPNTASYNLYTSGTSVTDFSAGPGTFSLTCLSCHDGTIGIGTITKNSVSTTFSMTGNVDGNGKLVDDAANTAYNPLIGTDLRNDHPVGFQWNSAEYGVSTGAGIGATVTGSGNSGAAVNGENASNAGLYPLFYYNAGARVDIMECATCHDPHLEDNGTVQTKFLRSLNGGMCQDCHSLK